MLRFMSARQLRLAAGPPVVRSSRPFLNRLGRRGPARRIALATVVVLSVGGTAGIALADASSPACATPGVNSGTISPPLPGKIVNTGTDTVTVTANSGAGCGWAIDRTLHYWAPNPTWFEAPQYSKVGARRVKAQTIDKHEATGTTTTTHDVKVPAEGEIWVGVRYHVPDRAHELGFGMNDSALIPTRLVVRTAPRINALPPVLVHDNKNTPLKGTAWAGDKVTVRDGAGKVICTTTAKPDGSWSCVAAQRFPHGITHLRVSETGTGANNPKYPSLSDKGLPDLHGNTVETRVITADAAVTMELDKPKPAVGDVVTYRVVATNNGPDTAVDVSLTDVLPEGVVHVSHTVTKGAFDAAAGAWSGIGDLAKGAKQTLTIKARVTKRGTFTNPADIKATAATDGTGVSRLVGADGVPDWNLDRTNDHAEATLTTVPQCDVTISKNVDLPVTRVGRIVKYTIKAHNNGPDTATGVVVTEAVPSGVRLISGVPTVGTFDPATNVWTIGDLTAGENAELQVTARVRRAGKHRNVATIRDTGAKDSVSGSSYGDTNPNNDTAEAVVQADQPVAAAAPPASPSPAAAAPANATAQPALPVTGTQLTGLLAAGLAVTLTGLALLFGARRRTEVRRR